MQPNRLRRSFAALAMTLVTAVSGTLLVGPAPAHAAGLANPSATLTVECPGASAFIQVDWLGPNRVTVRWSLEDTGTAAGFSPVLRINAIGSNNVDTPMIFPGGNTYYVLRSGNGTSEVGLEGDWNPENIADLNHLKVKVQNGTTAQDPGDDGCTKSRNIFNWTRIAYNNAYIERDKQYRFGDQAPDYGLGPNYYDCSGLTLTSYDKIPLFPGFGSVRTSDSIYRWATTHTSPAKVYAKRVDRADAKVGDLFFYNLDGDSLIDHVDFYAGNNEAYGALNEDLGLATHPMWSGVVGIYRILGVSTD
ncbi:NlpC/P60 family protein [Kribbella sp. NPDC056345]|uniref:NlpC/P60 family protein n=1 Tax=Kribbella sp. NPDC056345 TaxID=3345789 RepID=UPI0035DB2C66